MAPTPPRRIDAHQHFWHPARGDYHWLRPDVAALAPICRDFDPADLQPLLSAHGVVQTVLVQAADSEAETDFLLSLAETHPFIGGVVGWVDLGRIESVATLERWARHPKLKGVRPMLQDLPDADWIARAPHPEVMRTLVRLGLRFDALVQPWHLQPLLRFLHDWPELPVVIDHAAKPQLAQGWSGDWAAAWRSGLAALAALPGVQCKLSGLLTEAAGPARTGGPPGVAALQPVWDTLLALFGPQRLLWGSDWPVLNLAADYARWIDVSETLVQPLTEAERDAIRCTNAARFYGLLLADTPTP
ncbi:amidohydrolase family protein [Sphaerotilus sp.]|uniref:amidohydrolase family protein n=1 Tax=Sphaerotilus sp. TaxID=2093942 RepID=UPI00286EAC96|nr:amidohydrolase family protein [Sphaerotilus sp.]